MTDTRVGWPRHVLLLAPGAILLRLLLLLGRGDYLAFDEGFYLLLARSIAAGDGYSLVGIPHITLSPLFPVLAAPVGAALDSWVWGGRVVAAVASGLVVLPAWSVFRRIGPPRTAFIAAALVAVLPSMAPFVAPYWIGADLWVGAEPLLHLFLYTGVALWLAADERGGLTRWAAAGGAFGLAFLARPEAILVWGLLGLVALGLATAARSPRRLAGAALMAVGFAVVCAPYWIHLHDVTGRWALTGRGRGLAPSEGAAQLVGAAERTGGAGIIEAMLWGDRRGYERYLYSLDETGLRMRSDYWGVYPAEPARPVPGDTTAPSAEAASAAAPADPAVAPPPEPQPSDPTVAALYVRSLGTIVPLLLWPFVLLGAAQPRGRAVLRRELPVTAALVGASVAIAGLVAVDPRTQLFLVPLLAFYAARGFSLLEQEVQRRAQGQGIRPGFVELALTGIAVLWLLAIDGRRLQLSLTLGSPHHIVGAQNRAVADELGALIPERDGPVMSWHPALAVYADRPWRPLPFAGLPAIVRYAGASGADVIVLSAYYPPDLGVENLDTRYLLMPVPPDAAARRGSWTVRFESGDTIRAVASLVPAP